jgi:hypothetical protein
MAVVRGMAERLPVLLVALSDRRTSRQELLHDVQMAMLACEA